MLWPQALDYLKEHRRSLAIGALPILLVVSALNVPWFPLPNYLRGLFTGSLLSLLVAVVIWVTWVNSGLALRLNGVHAEDAANAVLQKHHNVIGVVSSLRFGGFDVDQVAVTPAGVFAIEVKWRGMTPDAHQFESDVFQAASRGRTFRLSLKDHGLADAHIRPALVHFGPSARKQPISTIDSQFGTVVAMGSDCLGSWLDSLGTGPIGADFGTDLVAALEATAAARDQTVPASWLVRRLSRTP